jgi:hypothetical protein
MAEAREKERLAAEKAAGYFLLYLGHSQIIFGLIVRERHDFIVHES